LRYGSIIIPALAAGSNTIEEILAAYPYLEREDIAQIAA
jgi:uncharacterized protein (DUF433 family)